MKVKIRADSIDIEGYVNAIERDSKPLMSRLGRFIERVCKGAFKKALRRAEDVKILLNHDWSRELGSTAQGNLQLEEDNIGLHARAHITDPEVVEDARRGNLVGWSFGFRDREVENAMEDGLPLRKVRDLDLLEVSLLNRKMSPAYEGTLVSTRSEDGEEQIHFRGESMIDEETETTVEKPVENSADDDKMSTTEERKTEESTTEEENQEQKDTIVENSVEKNGKMNYNKAIGIIKKLKED
jgi:HK97 family phage prohead protease